MFCAAKRKKKSSKSLTKSASDFVNLYFLFCISEKYGGKFYRIDFSKAHFNTRATYKNLPTDCYCKTLNSERDVLREKTIFPSHELYLCQSIRPQTFSL
ncbi:Uncharacterized protein TSPI_07629 [Trichinella spiralis]|uniref:PiggyBac transposable element-derived protein domain-containing protein n=1 Tax=Trichinella spiralis TaxID=6334 RepID=A0ABR3KTA7_TRISP